MPEKTCGTCWWWKKEQNGLGECRRHPPTPIVMKFSEPLRMWPRTEEADWCGEWAARKDETDGR